MLKVIKKLTVLVVIMMLAAILGIQAAAIGFSVRPELPENQRDNGNAFFDLLVYPGQEQYIFVNVTNTLDEEITMLVEVVTASTTRYGEINYTAAGRPMDETLRFSFEDIASLAADYVVIPVGESADIPVRLTIPDEQFEGMILGSIRVLREPTASELAAAGAITNQFAFVTAVRLVQDENAEAIPAEFILSSVTPELVHSRANIIATIRNPQPKIIRRAGISAAVYPSGGGEAIFVFPSETFDMAPNSIFNLSFIDWDGRGLQAGDYNAVIDIEYGGRTWNFEYGFTIEPTSAATINEGALNIVPPPPWWEGIPPWAYAIMGASAAIIVLLLINIMGRNKDKRDMQVVTP